ncbi:alpha-ketoglutarate-dependent dioxygenase AlkB [Nitrospirillum sp. BR 11163]|uniref:alpha-ketoglutarate-dependent dioxygenase AlkB n=1 Tax=Nitrospirillum sp. BR 11163 TaxID=3104323 RepID=UPI002AFF3FF7|nr:alpha-ketoglutarate-dependent dioxygenase AlkB [Nitrospirillum sp. BR 11163]MEA1672828.1 alpha-ketoglutarate-dependent dioxygenase AlkB [Nitrospirillum sp. BR 11163]
MQTDLFASTSPASSYPIVPGLGFKSDFISAEMEAELIAEIGKINLPHFSFQGWTARRRTRSFGWLYDFNNSNFGPTEPIPGFLLSLRLLMAGFAGVAADNLVQVSLIHYAPGAGIGWHKDRPELDAVIGVSLGSAATMRFRRRVGSRFDRATILLPPRSVYHLDGEVRHAWEHSIAPGTADRWSITFRGLSESGRRRSAAHVDTLP